MEAQYDVKTANALFLPLWNSVARSPREPVKSKQEEAMAFFRNAVRDCDKEIGKIVDAHHKSVAESAKKLAEYHKRKALQDQIRNSARERHLINERIRIDSINHQNMLESLRVEELNRRERMKQSS